MGDRVEIFKNGTWVELVLKQEKLKYNQVINRIGSLGQRKINHSNTFSLPYVSENIIALGINVFSPVLMAEALNKKFPARYYVKDKLLQRGFLVINNTVRGEISVNFIDEALIITDEWGKITFRNLLKTLVSSISLYPKQVISPSVLSNLDTLSSYLTNKSVKVLNTPSCFCDTTDDSSIAGKEIYVVKYPNNLNNIGEKYQLDSNEVRRLDFFNPYQTRPIFSLFSFMYLICQAFGYKLKLDPGVDVDTLRDTYLTSKGVAEAPPLEDVLISSETPTITEPSTSYYFGIKPKGAGGGLFTEYFWGWYFEYPNTTVTVEPSGKKIGVESLTPAEVGDYIPAILTEAFLLSGREKYTVRDPQVQKSIVKIEGDFLGKVKWIVTAKLVKASFSVYRSNSVWKNSTGGTIVKDFDVSVVISFGSTSLEETRTITGDKEQLNNPPVGAVSFVGLNLELGASHVDFTNKEPTPPSPTIVFQHFTEEILPRGIVSYDNYGQYTTLETNLLDLAPDLSVKELLASVLQQQGLLMTFERDSFGTQNIVKLFTYGAYRDRVGEARAGQLNKYYDWSQYHQKLIAPLFNTDYGSQYGEMNEISLTNPFKGNVGHIQISTNITSKGFQTKLIPLAKNTPKSLDDIEAVNLIMDTESFFEYTHQKQGLVSCGFDDFLPAGKKQYNAQAVGYTALSDPIPKVTNVIYSDSYLPVGIKELYYLVDVAVKSQATFLLPIYVIQTFDISLPIYVESLGGFYIVEEIEEYSDDVTLVKVNLIKLPL